ncbi:N-6 DNA methylase [Palleronia aestuarii]|uniref:site-specific DNA-methyltransferase (adenine-specific) n=1 Tax=Palleronia aestuarii TaxID=568105 RepID=A0A2W7MUS1_9RHOB|nr:N-6 DNA methylase [Palleronia aestuarii]PZX11788.1 N-6 DNA methylase [Palleronia aestuarii]
MTTSLDPTTYIPADVKANGAYYTPDAVARSLVSWAVRDETDAMLDPACGDGRFLMGHVNAVGVEQDPRSAAVAKTRAPGALVHEGDFFRWAAHTEARFDCAAGNPPFIRYQLFKGETRRAALELCARHGAQLSGLASSWAPFLVAAGSLVRMGGRMAFVVPAEIGHAPYAAPLIEWLCGRFAHVQIVAVREKLFPGLSEDCWLLYAEGAGGCTDHVAMTVLERFAASNAPPKTTVRVPLVDWRATWNRRLRPFLLSAEARALYAGLAKRPGTRRLGDLASVGIGYVSGANAFFHLRSSEAAYWCIPPALLQPAIRNGRMLPGAVLNRAGLDRLVREDAPIHLLRLHRGQDVPREVRRYLDSPAGQVARTAYKCRVRDPWYAVPDIKVPHYFLSYMSGRSVGLVRNDARATCPNTLHCVTLKDRRDVAAIGAVRRTPAFQLSCEIEGHPLGGGMLKLEPREAARVAIPDREGLAALNEDLAQETVAELQRWRHYALDQRYPRN